MTKSRFHALTNNPIKHAPPARPVPSARDVERFAYCAHNWLLARQGVDPTTEASRTGIEEHRQKGVAQAQVEADKREYRSAFQWFFRLLGFAASATFLTLELMYLRATRLHIILLTTALVLVGASAGLLVLSILAERKYREEEREAGLVPGQLVGTDLAGQGELLRDPEWGLTGRPDYILETPNGLVPVEVKTGHAPEHPHRSHALQVACYLRLLEASGKKPTYGLLNYTDGVFRIGWDDALKADLKATLGRIAEAERTGRADRDHQHPARCRGCARRDACDQRLA
jgi:CRISPR-associated exonuclease Cas4